MDLLVKNFILRFFLTVVLFLPAVVAYNFSLIAIRTGELSVKSALSFPLLLSVLSLFFYVFVTCEYKKIKGDLTVNSNDCTSIDFIDKAKGVKFTSIGISLAAVTLCLPLNEYILNALNDLTMFTLWFISLSVSIYALSVNIAKAKEVG